MPAVSSSCCLSSVVRKGSEEATKSTSRLGSSMLAQWSASSSESVGDSETICWNCADHVAHQRLERRSLAAGSMSSSVSTSATMKGSVCE
jgi:hypothetical protein